MAAYLSSEQSSLPSLPIAEMDSQVEGLEREMLRASLSLTAFLFRKCSLILPMTLQMIKDVVSVLHKRKPRGTGTFWDGWPHQLLASSASGAEQ